MDYIFNFNFIAMLVQQSNVERFYEWMLSINNKFLHDHNQMANAFRIVSLCDVNDIEVVEPITITPN